jgi:hypothetical protein
MVIFMVSPPQRSNAPDGLAILVGRFFSAVSRCRRPRGPDLTESGVVVDSAGVERVALIAALKPGAREQALDLLQTSARDAGASVRELIDDPVRSATVGPWLPLFEGPLHLARGAYFLELGGDG